MLRGGILGATALAAAIGVVLPSARATTVGVDEFSVTRAGTQIFDDSFNRNAALNGGTNSSGTTFSDNPAISANYLVSGSFTESSAGDGTANLNTTNGTTSFNGALRVGAELLTGTNTSSTHLLSPANSFSIVGLFNFTAPSTVGGAYGVELSNTNGTAGRTLEISVENCGPTVPGCGGATGVVLSMTLLDFATNTATTLTKLGLTAGQLAASQVELELSDPGSSDTITASYAFGSGDTLGTFNGSLTALGSTDAASDVFSSPSFEFVEPEFQAFNIAAPEPSSLLLLTSGIFGLGLLARRRRARPDA